MKHIIAIIVTLVFVSCTSSYSPMMGKVAYSKSNYTNKQKISKSANISLDVDDIKKVENNLEKIIKQYEAIIHNSNISQDGRFYSYIKVPQKNLYLFLQEVEKIGKLTSKSIQKSDISNYFVNTEAKLKNLKLFKIKMSNLLSKSNKIEDILKIERELNRIQIDIDRIEAMYNNQQNRVDYSPVNISFKEETIYGPVGYILNGLWWGVKKLFIIR